MIAAGYDKYINSDLDELKIFPETKDVLRKLCKNFELVLVTKGSVSQQNKKVDILEIRDFF